MGCSSLRAQLVNEARLLPHDLDQNQRLEEQSAFVLNSLGVFHDNLDVWEKLTDEKSSGHFKPRSPGDFTVSWEK